MPPLDGSKAAMHVDARTVLDDIQRTGQLIEELRRLKKYGGSRMELQRLKDEISRLRTTQLSLFEANKINAAPCVRSEPPPASTRSDGLMVTPRSHTGQRLEESRRPSLKVLKSLATHCSGQRATEQRISQATPRHSTQYRSSAPSTDKQERSSGTDREEYRKYCSVAFAVVLAEAHTRREIIHKCEKRRMKLMGLFREGRILISSSQPSAIQTHEDNDIPRFASKSEAKETTISPPYGTLNHHSYSIPDNVIASRHQLRYTCSEERRGRGDNFDHGNGGEPSRQAEEADIEAKTETKRKAQEEAEAKRKAQEEAEARREAEEEAEAKRKAQEEAEARREAEAEAEAKRKAQEEAEAKRKAAEEAEAKRRAEEEAEAKR
ncbi:kinetoplast DNA-associated protein, partial [Trypanosoma grayi]|uniref:kinetoplast DNA-associated protein n=1 Tax=Trypanosoma grayi TaxID=71804 RepID=UPI0004F45B53